MCLWDPAGLHVGIFLGPRSGCPCGTRKNMIVGFRWVPCVAAHLLYGQQRWSPRGRPWPRGRPRGQILKSLASKVKSLALASSPRKLACPRLEDSTIFWKVKILWSGWKIFWKAFFRGNRLKNFVKTFFFFFFFFFFGDRLKNFCEDLFFFFFLESTCALCPWSLASSIPVLGLESVCPRKGCPWPWIFFVSLALSLVSSTPPLMGSPCGIHKYIIVGFRWARCVASHFLYGQPTRDPALCESPK